MRARIVASFVEPEHRKWWTLGAVTFGLFMIMLDNTIVNVALPTIQRDLDVGLSQLEWIFNGYALTFAVLILTGGKLADLLGRRRIFLIGLVIFTASSLACGLAPSAELLIGARVVQGAGAALMNPSTLSIITATFPPRQRGMAIGIWAGVSASGLAFGPVLGGVITEHVGWSWVFFINVPVGLLAIVVARLAIDESRDTSREQRLDLPGLVASGVTLFALTYGLIEANNEGWTSPLIIGLFVVAAAGLAAFVLLERHQRVPMLDLSLFTSRTFSAANVVMILIAIAMIGVFFYISLYFQLVLGFSPTRAGAAFLPMSGFVIVVAPLAGRISDRVGSRWLMSTGMSLLAGGLLWLSTLEADSSYLHLLPGLIMAGIGIPMTMAPATGAAMSSVPVDKAGVGSGVLNTMRQVGASLGVAMMGAIIAAHVHVPPTNPSAREQFVDGLHVAMLVGSMLAFAGATVSVSTIRHLRHAPAAPPAAG